MDDGTASAHVELESDPGNPPDSNWNTMNQSRVRYEASDSGHIDYLPPEPVSRGGRATPDFKRENTAVYKGHAQQQPAPPRRSPSQSRIASQTQSRTSGSIHIPDDGPPSFSRRRSFNGDDYENDHGRILTHDGRVHTRSNSEVPIYRETHHHREPSQTMPVQQPVTTVYLPLTHQMTQSRMEGQPAPSSSPYPGKTDLDRVLDSRLLDELIEGNRAKRSILCCVRCFGVLALLMFIIVAGIGAFVWFIGENVSVTVVEASPHLVDLIVSAHYAIDKYNQDNATSTAVQLMNSLTMATNTIDQIMSTGIFKMFFTWPVPQELNVPATT